MGTGGFLIPTCREPDFGDDGILRSYGNTTRVGCAGSYPAFLSFRFGDDPAAFADDVACVATVGTNGCGFQQPLEAALKALTPSTSSTTFAEGTRGHGDVESSGFLRPTAYLALVMLSDGDDCSASEAGLFDPSSTRYTTELALRCATYPEALYPMSRYAGALLHLFPDYPQQLLFAALVGVPPDLVQDAGYADYDVMLADPRIQVRADPSMTSRLTPSCDDPVRGMAFPPVRFVTLASELQDNDAFTTVQSICQDDLTPAVDGILAKVAAMVGARPACLYETHGPRDADGRVVCELAIELASSGTPTSCGDLLRGPDACARGDGGRWASRRLPCATAPHAADRQWLVPGRLLRWGTGELQLFWSHRLHARPAAERAPRVLRLPPTRRSGFAL